MAISISKNFPVIALIIILTGSLVLLSLFSAPRDFPVDSIITVDDGLVLDEIIETLDKSGALRSPIAFKILIRGIGAGARVNAGYYQFEEPLSAPRLAWRLVKGIHGISQVRVRFPEGATRSQVADIFSNVFDKFDSRRFLELTKGKEGYLFPDTYFFFINVTAEDVAERLEGTFQEKIKEFDEDLMENKYSLEEIITMASIIEREAHDPVDQRLISGVLWNRIDIGMALQADATLFYLLGKPSSELTIEDLETDSPYNTYVYPGLPPTPIGNPGLTAIDAALNPTESDYFFYLSDSDGVTHYAENFEMHKENKRIYLR